MRARATSQSVRPGIAIAIAVLYLVLWPIPGTSQEPGATPPPTNPDEEGLRPSVFTRAEARTFNFKVPAPRGQILDRTGRVLANNRVRFYLAVQLPTAQGVNDAEVLATCLNAIRQGNAILGTSWNLEYENILTHFKHRRWFPLRISPRPLSDEQYQAIIAQLPALKDGESTGQPGLALQPIYLREYPEGAVAGHILGYVGRETPLETEAIRAEELLFENFAGRSGLEKHFNELLTGKDGIVNYTFDETGALVEKRVITAPEPGQHVVTTLNLEMQKLAEAQLAEKSKRGAAVVVDAESGDILAMASHPGFDPNLFVPFIGTKTFDGLNNDPDVPLFGRAFSAAYPPGSTFKTFVSCAVLTHGPVRPWTRYSAPPSLWIGDREFKNWNEKPEGSIDVITALKRSANTWFYQAALDTGSAPIIHTALAFGFGKPTGLPLAGEAAGSLPDQWDLPAGQTANISIGQGQVLSTPLQLAIATAAIGNGRHYPNARLVSRIQNLDNQVVDTFPNNSRGYMPYSRETIDAVQIGMDEVVNASGGTAGRARLEQIRVAGKTGTAQWSSGDGNLRHLAWFSGFTFTANPKLAFAVVYEGDLGEEVSGGAIAAPIAHGILQAVYEQPGAFALAPPERTDPPVLVTATPVSRYPSAQAAPAGSSATAAASPLPDPPQPPPRFTEPKPKRRSFLRGLFGRNRP